MNHPPPVRRSIRAAAPLGLSAVLLVTHLPTLLAHSTIQDEAVYVVVARELLQGGRLYIDVVDRKPPLLFWLYEGILRICGSDNWLALHLVGVLWVLATMWGLYVVGRRLAGVPAGVAAALLYTVFQTFWDVSNLAFNGEVMMNLPLVLGFAIAFHPDRSRWRPALLLAGAMPAIGFLLKQPAGIAGLPLGVYVLLASYRRARGIDWRHSAVHALWLILGFVFVLAEAALILQHEGLLRDAVYWSVLDHDVSYGPLSAVFWARGGRMALIFSVCCAPLLLGTWWSLRHPELWATRRPERTVLLVWLAAAMIGTAASGRFFDYYFIQLLPPLCLLAAPWFGYSWVGVAQPRRARWTQAAVSLCAVIFLVVNLIRAPGPIGQNEISQYIRTHSAPEDRLFVWGQYPKFYLHADLRPASRYIAFFPLTGYIFGSPWNRDPSREDTRDRILPGAWANLDEDFTRNPPRYILDTEGIQRFPKYPISSFPQLHDLLVQNYRLVFTASVGLLYERGVSPAPRRPP
ncbi:MAG: glycosyltransferase family 39 protein [Gemmatimonadota bacterium]